MTTATDPKRRITVEASNQLRRMATKPGYVTAVERAAAVPAAGPFDNAGGPFPFDIPSQAFDHHLRALDEAINQAEHQIGQLRSLAQSIRSVADGRLAGPTEPPPPPEPLTYGKAADLGIATPGVDFDPLIDPETPFPSVEAERGPMQEMAAQIIKEDRQSAKALATAVVNKMLDDGMEPAEIEAAIKPVPSMTWTCPDHGQYAEAISRKGRPYRYCPLPDCGKLDIMLETR